MTKQILILTLLLTNAVSADNLAEKIKIQNQNVVKMAAKGLSEKLPQKVDDYTTLVKMKAQGETLIYTYELNVTGKSDKELEEEGKQRMQKPVKNGICNSSKRFLDSGINISYIYISAVTKNELFRFDVEKKDCNY